MAYGLQRKVNNLKSVNLSENFDLNNFQLISQSKKAMRNSMFNPSQFLVRTDFVKMVGGCDERIKFSQEYSLTLKLSLLGDFARLNFPVAVLPFNAPGQISEKKIIKFTEFLKLLNFLSYDNPKLDNQTNALCSKETNSKIMEICKKI